MTNDSNVRKQSLFAVGIGYVGKTLIVLGLLLLGFVGYQLWGTSIEESRAQSDLARSFSSSTLPSDAFSTTLPPGTSTSVAPQRIHRGEAIGRIVIPKIGVDKWIVAGVDWESLKKGPGLYMDGPLPGQRGNAAIAGHRTTFGSPFERIDELKPGDIITIDTRQGTFGYIVVNTKIVDPYDISVLDPDPKVESSVTLISCYPKYSSTKRIIVRANYAPDNTSSVLPSTPLASVTDTAQVPLTGGWFHDTGGIVPSLALGGVLVAVALVPKLSRRRWPSLTAQIGTFIVTAAVFLPVLYYFYQNISRLVPTNL